MPKLKQFRVIDCDGERTKTGVFVDSTASVAAYGLLHSRDWTPLDPSTVDEVLSPLQVIDPDTGEQWSGQIVVWATDGIVGHPKRC